MNRSPLQLKHYHFVSLALQAREDIDPASLAESAGPYPDFDGITLEPEVSLFSDDDAGECGPYLLRLAMGYHPEDDHFPYSFEVVIEGVFSLEDGSNTTDCKKTVVINGASVLYSAVREQLMTLSGRHLYGPMLLPALNFQHLDV
jgi:hypothetical protein